MKQLSIEVWEGSKETNEDGAAPQGQQQWEPWPLLGLKEQVREYLGEPKEIIRAVKEGHLIGAVAFTKEYNHPQYSGKDRARSMFHSPAGAFQ